MWVTIPTCGQQCSLMGNLHMWAAVPILTQQSSNMSNHLWGIISMGNIPQAPQQAVSRTIPINPSISDYLPVCPAISQYVLLFPSMS